MIDTIWDVHDPQQVQVHKAYAGSIGTVNCHGVGQNPGNQQRRFHGTYLECNFSGRLCGSSSCAVCCIIKTGFDFGRAGSSAGSIYGAGVYSTSTPWKAYGYTKNKKSMQAPQFSTILCWTAVNSLCLAPQSLQHLGITGSTTEFRSRKV